MMNPASLIDHTLLKATTTGADIDLLCEEAVEYGFAAVCVPPTFVGRSSHRLYGSGVEVATVIGFPLGYELSEIKKMQAERAIAAGATEIDMVIDLGAAKAGDLERVHSDIAAVVSACGSVPVKTILECCLFDAGMKEQLARTAVQAGAAFVKTSTGFAEGGATVEDVKLLTATVDGRAGVKAAGGIRDWESCQRMIAAGATRIGASAGVEIVRQWLADQE
ncbi:MAG: deoxyribose-phosphate aldolase [Desulfuromonas sp.]|nr:MAG: deoxyribose-phosphate aldolase [Desulfuromonas sp.]